MYWLPGFESDTVIRIQILEKTVCISYSANTLWKCINQIIPFSALGKAGLFNLGIATDLWEEKLISNLLNAERQGNKWIHSYISINIDIYAYIYVVNSISFQTYFYRHLKSSDSWKFSMLLLCILWDDWPIFYDFRFKWTATGAIGIHPTKAWLSQLLNFKNAIWTWGHFRKTICDKILF